MLCLLNGMHEKRLLNVQCGNKGFLFAVSEFKSEYDLKHPKERTCKRYLQQ
jgi:hypothetical protein